MKYVLTFLLLFTFTGVVQSAERNTAESVSVERSNLWVVKFYANWCGPCKELSKVFARPEVVELMLGYANEDGRGNRSGKPFEVDIDKADRFDKEKVETIMVAKYASYLRKGIPLTLIIDGKGKVGVYLGDVGFRLF